VISCVRVLRFFDSVLVRTPVLCSVLPLLLPLPLHAFDTFFIATKFEIVCFILFLLFRIFRYQICAALGVESVSFGYEKSADYGNGICVNDVEVGGFFEAFFCAFLLH
jgi:hypothetical protein